jgi:phosphate transport system ATP-binding protein
VTAGEPSPTETLDDRPVRDRPTEPAVRLEAISAGNAARRPIERKAFSVNLQQLNAWYGEQHSVKDVTLTFHANEATALIGPSGSGKSTIVRCINRMHEEIKGARAEGSVTLDEIDIYDRKIDLNVVRRSIGMVFQKPNPFLSMSIYDNVAAGVRLTTRRVDPELVESALQRAGLWNEVKDRLNRPGMSLSGGQQQRLCIARALAVEPDVLLMDEPASALDPISTLKIEELVHELKSRLTIVIVTHNMQQAARVADRTAFLMDGELVEVGATDQIFTQPNDKRTEDYVSGRFG